MPFFKRKTKNSETQSYQPIERQGDSPPSEGGHDESNWLVSYADMMTLLCGFFVMLFSLSKVDEPKYNSFKETVSQQFGGKYTPPPSKELAQFITKVVQENGLEAKTTIKSDTTSVTVVFESTIFFETLSANITTQGRKLLNNFIRQVFEHQINLKKSYKIVVEGHTDGRPIIGGIYPSNWELSGARSARVVRMFLDSGFSPSQMISIGYADTQPQVDARTLDGQWDESKLAKNRRVILRILEPNAEAIPIQANSSLNG